MSGVKRFYATDYETEYPGGRFGQICVVKASDYDALRTANQRLEGEVAALRSLLNEVARIDDKLAELQSCSPAE
jgi:hypothetical protein